MPEGYMHLAYEQRCQIYTLLKRGDNEFQIATAIGVNPSSINRELKRNSGKRGYRFKQAHKKLLNAALKRAQRSVHLYVEKMICERQWSPEQIAERMKVSEPVSVSHESIYRFIWSDQKRGGRMYKHLRRRGKKVQQARK